MDCEKCGKGYVSKREYHEKITYTEHVVQYKEQYQFCSNVHCDWKKYIRNEIDREKVKTNYIPL